MSQENVETQETIASAFVAQELESTRKALKNTQIWGSVVVGCLTLWLGSIAGGFAKNLEPSEAAKIAKGLAAQRIMDYQPQISQYLRTEIPRVIEQAPEYALGQIPVYRQNIEEELESKFHTFASDTSDSLDAKLDAFLVENQEQFKTIILAGQDKETTDQVASEMRTMFINYLTTSSADGESIQDKLDASLKALKEIEHRTWRMATQKDLTDSELKTRRAVAVLFHTIDENKDAWNLPNKEEVQEAIKGFLPDHESEPATESQAAPAESPRSEPGVARSAGEPRTLRPNKSSRPDAPTRPARPASTEPKERPEGKKNGLPRMSAANVKE